MTRLLVVDDEQFVRERAFFFVVVVVNLLFPLFLCHRNVVANRRRRRRRRRRHRSTRIAAGLIELLERVAATVAVSARAAALLADRTHLALAELAPLVRVRVARVSAPVEHGEKRRRQRRRAATTSSTTTTDAATIGEQGALGLIERRLVRATVAIRALAAAAVSALGAHVSRLIVAPPVVVGLAEGQLVGLRLLVVLAVVGASRLVELESIVAAAEALVARATTRGAEQAHLVVAAHGGLRGARPRLHVHVGVARLGQIATLVPIAARGLIEALGGRTHAHLALATTHVARRTLLR